MSPEFDALMDGIALFFVFIGLFGFAISNNQMWLCFALVGAGVVVKLGYMFYKAWRAND